jgi:hypothetical protein
VADAILAATGKDITLTGRTDLWRVGLEQIAERPWLGQGYQAFWQPGNPEAEHLWRAFGIESRTGFHFHNLYLSNAVEIGIPGAALQAVFLSSSGSRRSALRWPRSTTAPPFLAMTVMVLAMTPLGSAGLLSVQPADLHPRGDDGLCPRRAGRAAGVVGGRDRRQKGARLIVHRASAERARKLVAQDAARDGP